MHNERVTLWIGFATAFLALTTYPANANNFGNTQNLPDATQIERSRLQVDIVNKNPIVRDTRKAPEDTTYVINVPPMPTAQHNVVQIGIPTATAGNPETVPIMRSGLPNAQFGSNIPANPVVQPNSLPGGSSTNRLARLSGERIAKNRQAPDVVKLAPGVVTPVETKTYGITFSALNSDSHHAVSSVKAVLQEKGALLK
ncbi:MAG TPA: hypothetical protein V6C86_15225 [Oculatellaceae cyanobacterium]